MRFLALIIFTLLTLNCRAQDILYFMPDSIEVKMYNYLQKNKDINPLSAFVFLERGDAGYKFSLGVCDERVETNSQKVILKNSKRKAVVNDYRIPVVFDMDIDFYFNGDISEKDFVLTLYYPDQSSLKSGPF